MKNATCTECDRPMFDQSTPDDCNLCDECWAEIEAERLESDNELFYY